MLEATQADLNTASPLCWCGENGCVSPQPRSTEHTYWFCPTNPDACSKWLFQPLPPPPILWPWALSLILRLKQNKQTAQIVPSLPHKQTIRQMPLLCPFLLICCRSNQCSVEASGLGCLPLQSSRTHTDRQAREAKLCTMRLIF